VRGRPAAMAACSAQSGGGRRTLAGPGGPKGRMGRLAAGSIGQNWKENSFQSKNWFFNIPWLWKFVQEDIGGILMWGFFLNSSWLFKDFRKIKYAMPCNAMHPMQDYFWQVFHMHDKLICNLYALLYWQNFILVKCGYYSLF
jgi:hypothetical protein